MYEELVKDIRYCVSDGPCGECRHITELCCDTKLMEKAADAIDELDTLIDSLEADNDALCETIERLKKPRWIPITKRLPNKNDDVLIYGEGTGASGTKYREVWLTDLKEFMLLGYKPIAWMPLPEPPMEDEA